MRHKGAIIIRWTMVLPLVAAILFLGSKTIRIPSSSPKHHREPRRELRRSSSHTPRLALLNSETRSIVSAARSDKQSALDQLSKLRAEVSQELEDQEVRVFGKDLPEVALERAKAFSAMIKRRLAWMEEKLQEGALSELEDSVAIWTAEPVPVALGVGPPGMRTIEEKELRPKMTPRICPAHGGVDGEPSLKPPAPSRGDTSATLEIDLESEILQELAENLDHDPRRILEYVQGHMRYEPYVGSMKGAEETYLTGGGNDVDQASLMMALLRISGIPCRYVEGVIRLKTERVMDWMGVQTAMAAACVLKLGGIPYVPINGAGPDGVESFDIDHVWVEAYVGVQNYRGAPGDERGKIWVPLAPAIKEMEARGSVNVIEEMAASGTPFEAEDFFDVYIAGLERRSPVAVFEDSVVTYLSDAHPGMSIEEAKRKLSIKGKSYPILPLSLPAKILAVRGEYDECPEDWRFKVKVKAYAGSDTLLSVELALPAVGTRCMVLGFKPETEADAEILIRYGGVYGAPAYLVRVTPVLRLQGETVAYGEGGIGLGKEYKVWFRVEGPKGVFGEQEMRKTAGMQWGVGIVSGRVPGVLDRVRRGGNSEGLHGRELHELVMRYWEGAWGEQERFGELWWTRVMNEPDVSLTSTRLLVDKVYGQPVGVSWCGLYVNVHARVGIVELAREVSDRDVVWRGMVFVGMGTLSWMEHRIFEEKYKVSAISGVLALERGIEQGVGVYDVDSTNVESQLGLMDLPVWAEERIRGYVHMGYKVKAVGEKVTQGEWEGVGYMCWKERGEGGYIIQRDLGGGETTEPFIWGGWNTFWIVVCGWQNYYPDIPAGPEEDNLNIPCDLCSTRVEWEGPPDSSVWAWGDSIPVSRYDTLFWEDEEEPEVLGPDTCWFRTWEHDPDLWTFRAQIFGIYPDAPPGLEEEPIWYFGGDTLRFWTVKVEPDTTQSSMLFEVPLEGEEGVKDTAQTVFTILPDTSFFESPTMESLKYWHYVTRETEGGVVDTVKSKVRFGLDSLEVHEVSGDPYWVKKWLQQDDAHEWLDPADNPFESHIRMEWVNRDEETRQTTRHNNDEEHEAEGIRIDLVVYLPDGSELPEEAEQGAGSGMFVKLNDDYDAGQEIPDWELERVPGENDLVRIEIKPTFDEQGQLVQVGKLTLEIAKPEGEGGGMGDLLEKVKIWKHREKGSGNLLIGGDELPSKTWDLTSGEDVEELMKFVGDEPRETLWVEGSKEPSERLKDWRLVLTWEDEQGSKADKDEVEGTVIQIDNVWALSNADNAALFSDNPTPGVVAEARTVTLRAVVQVTPEPEEGFGHYWAAEDGQASIGGQTITVKQRGANWPRLDIKWNVLLPYMQHVTLPCNDPDPSHSYPWYTNSTVDAPYRWLGYGGRNGGNIPEESGLDDVIEYAQDQIWNGWEVVLANMVGTARFRIAECMSKYTAGKEDGETRCNLVYQGEDDCYDRGVMGSVLRIVRRSSDASIYLSCLDAYTRVPWIMGSCCSGGGQVPPEGHQTERFVGFDCADFVVGAARLAGLTTINYCGAHELAVTYLQHRGNYGWLYMELDGTIHSSPSGDEVVIPIGDGENDLHVGDVILFDWGQGQPMPYEYGDGQCDHTTVFQADDGDGNLSANDMLRQADHPGVVDKELDETCRSEYHRFVLRYW